jgi:hypothetical protein
MMSIYGTINPEHLKRPYITLPIDESPHTTSDNGWGKDAGTGTRWSRSSGTDSYTANQNA